MVKCSDCRFRDTLGRCRFGPPSVMPVAKLGYRELVWDSNWPYTEDNDWCGRGEVKTDD